MGNMNKALAKIAFARNNNDSVLHLSGLGLDATELEDLIPKIKEIESLRRLELNGNALTTLPEALGTLKKLEQIHLHFNNLTHLPEAIGNLSKLKKLGLSFNRLRILPESLANLADSINAINLKDNPLDPETMYWLHHSFADGKVSYNSEAHEQHMPFEQEVLKILCGKEAFFVSDLIANSAGFLSPVLLGADQKKSESPPKILTLFLKGIPIYDPLFNSVYRPAADRFLGAVFNSDASREDRQEALQVIATSLGDCATSVKSLLIQDHIRHCAEKVDGFSAADKSLIEREALEEHLIKNLSELLQKNERIEQVQGLLNTIYWQGAETMEGNPIKIIGDRLRLPSKTAYVKDSLSRRLAGEDKEALVSEFTKLVCKTDPMGTAIKQDGVYRLDPAKMKVIVEKYMADRGIVSDIERHAKAFVLEVKDILEVPENNALYCEHLDKPKVAAFLGAERLAEDLRVKLQTQSPEMYAQTRTAYLLHIKEELAQLREEYPPTPEEDTTEREEHTTTIEEGLSALGSAHNKSQKSTPPIARRTSSQEKLVDRRSPSHSKGF